MWQTHRHVLCTPGREVFENSTTYTCISSSPRHTQRQRPWHQWTCASLKLATLLPLSCHSTCTRLPGPVPLSPLQPCDGSYPTGNSHRSPRAADTSATPVPPAQYAGRGGTVSPLATAGRVAQPSRRGTSLRRRERERWRLNSNVADPGLLARRCHCPLSPRPACSPLRLLFSSLQSMCHVAQISDLPVGM